MCEGGRGRFGGVVFQFHPNPTTTTATWKNYKSLKKNKNDGVTKNLVLYGKKDCDLRNFHVGGKSGGVFLFFEC